jgi:hypothetical protein
LSLSNERANRLLRIVKNQKTLQLPDGLWNLVKPHFTAESVAQADYDFRYFDPVASRERLLRVRIHPVADDAGQTSNRRLLIALIDPSQESAGLHETTQPLIRMFHRTVSTHLRDAVELTARLHRGHEDDILKRRLEGILSELGSLRGLLDEVYGYADLMDNEEQMRHHVCERIPDVIERAVGGAVEAHPVAEVDLVPEPALRNERISVPERLVYLAVSGVTTSLTTVFPDGRLELRSGLRNAHVELQFTLWMATKNSDLISSKTKDQVDALIEAQGDLVPLRAKLVRELIERANGTSTGPISQHNRICWTIRLPRRIPTAADGQDKGRVEKMVKTFFGRA